MDKLLCRLKIDDAHTFEECADKVFVAADLNKGHTKIVRIDGVFDRYRKQSIKRIIRTKTTKYMLTCKKGYWWY